MQLDGKKTYACFKKAKLIKEHARIYCLSPDRRMTLDLTEGQTGNRGALQPH
jgi:hypothetical protein